MSVHMGSCGDSTSGPYAAKPHRNRHEATPRYRATALPRTAQGPRPAQQPHSNTPNSSLTEPALRVTRAPSRGGVFAKKNRMQTSKNRLIELDFFRGLVLVFIVVDHIGGSILSRATLHAYALCDAAEVFVFLGGFATATAYASLAKRHTEADARNRF